MVFYNQMEVFISRKSVRIENNISVWKMQNVLISHLGSFEQSMIERHFKFRYGK